MIEAALDESHTKHEMEASCGSVNYKNLLEGAPEEKSDFVYVNFNFAEEIPLLRLLRGLAQLQSVTRLKVELLEIPKEYGSHINSYATR